MTTGLLPLAFLPPGGATRSDLLLDSGEGVSARASHARQNNKTDQQAGKNVISCEGIHPYGRVAMDESPFFKV
jgi:hypothetical protein